MKILGLLDATNLAKRHQDVVHDAGAKTSEKHNRRKDKTHVVNAVAIVTRFFIVVGELEELGGVRPRLGNEVVGEKQEGKKGSAL